MNQEIKIKAEKFKSPFNAKFKSVVVKASQDKVPLRLVLEALAKFKDQAYLCEALEQGNVEVYAKQNTRYIPLGAIPNHLYKGYLKTQNSVAL